MSAALQMTEEQIAEIPLAGAAPERAWRVPVELAVALAKSALAPLIQQRFEEGDRPFRDCVVFERAGHFYAWVDFEKDQPGQANPAVLLPMKAWPWHASAPQVVFGRRKVQP